MTGAWEERDFGKLKFGINFQLRLCSPIKLLGTPGLTHVRQGS